MKDAVSAILPLVVSGSILELLISNFFHAGKPQLKPGNYDCDKLIESLESQLR
jgi:hypothetical protein